MERWGYCGRHKRRPGAAGTQAAAAAAYHQNLGRDRDGEWEEVSASSDSSWLPPICGPRNADFVTNNKCGPCTVRNPPDVTGYDKRPEADRPIRELRVLRASNGPNSHGLLAFSGLKTLRSAARLVRPKLLAEPLAISLP